jgi:hypothetical protein
MPPGLIDTWPIKRPATARGPSFSSFSFVLFVFPFAFFVFQFVIQGG